MSWSIYVLFIVFLYSAAATRRQRAALPAAITVAAADTPNSETGNPEPARKQVTVLFCDIVDYTSRSVSLDPEELAAEIRVFQTLCAAVADKYHGHISNYLGDGILVLFGHPYASEFDPEHAARAGLEMVEQIVRNNASEQWRGREPIRIRVGIATGLVVVGERAGAAHDQDELIFGEAPNLAARLQSLAEPNSVVTALRTRRLVGAAFKFQDLGEHRLKGFAQPVHAWRVLRASAFQNRSTTSLKRVTTRFVSREGELRRLRENYAQALRGDCRIIHLAGDAGIGKSRLVRAFEKTIHKKDFHRLRVTCSPYFRNSPFKPIVDEAYRWLQIGEQDDVDSKRENIRSAMVEIELDGRDEHALFSELLAIPMPPGQAYLDISAEEKHHRTVDALTSFVIRLSGLRPLLLVVEDMHWADRSTLEVLGGIIARTGAENLFAIFTSRTGFVPPWTPDDSPADMKLDGLDARASGRLLSAVFGSRTLPAAVKQMLLRKSGGVPLFLEETSWHFLEQKRREQASPDQIREADPVGDFYGSFSLPDTLQDSLNARLDQLGEAKSFTQLAAAFGSDFRYSLVSKIAAKNGIGTDSSMDILLAADLISALPDKAENRYQFRHAMFQDAAYQSLLKKTRRRYHLQIAELLQWDEPDVGRRPDLLAWHYSRTEDTDTAVALWLEAGRQAIAQSAFNESLQHLSRGLKLAANLPEGKNRSRRQLALLLKLGVALTARSGCHGERVMRTYEQALALAETVGGDQQAGTALYGLWRCLVSDAEFSKSMRVTVKLKALSEKSLNPKLMMTTYGLQGMTRTVTAKFTSAEYFYDKAVRLYDRSRDKHMGVHFGQDPYVTLRGMGAVNKLLLNKIPASFTEITRSVEAARAIDHPYTVAETLRVAMIYHQIAGDIDRLKPLAEETVSLAETHGFEGLLAVGNFFLAFCAGMANPGHGQSGKVGLLERALKSYAGNHGKLFLPYFHGVLAEACLFLKDYGTALQATERALEMVDRFGEAWSRAPLLGIRVEAAARGGLATVAEIDQWRRTAIETAEAQQAKFVLERLLCDYG